MPLNLGLIPSFHPLYLCVDCVSFSPLSPSSRGGPEDGGGQRGERGYEGRDPEGWEKEAWDSLEAWDHDKMGWKRACMAGRVGLVLPLLLLWSVGSQGVGSAAGGGRASGSGGVGQGTFSGAVGPAIWSRAHQCRRPLMLRGGAPTRAAEPEYEEEEEEEIPWVRLRLHNACFGKSDFFDVVVDSDMLVRDFKKDVRLLARFARPAPLDMPHKKNPPVQRNAHGSYLPTFGAFAAT